MKDYLAPNLYLPLGSLCDYPGVHFRFLGLKIWFTAEYHSKPVFCVFVTHMSDLVVLGHSTGTISMAWTVTSRSLAASPDSCLRRKFAQAPASCCGLVLMGKLPWGQTFNPEPFPKDLKTITQKKVMQDKSCILLP